MLLALLVNNTTTVVGVFDDDALVHHWRLSTDAAWTPDELTLQLHGLLSLEGLRLPEDLTGVVVASVVPPLTDVVRTMVVDHRLPAVVVGPGIRTGIPLRYEDPREMGADRIANAVAAVELYGGPAIVVDFGTSTTFDAVDGQGAFLGGAIAPGVAVSVRALASSAAQLPEVTTEVPSAAIGRSTQAALHAGIVHGFAGQVDGIVRRITAELGAGVTVVATGRCPGAIREACETVDHHDPWLTLEGLRLLWHRNTR